MMPARLISALVAIAFAGAVVPPAAAVGSPQNFEVTQRVQPHPMPTVGPWRPNRPPAYRPPSPGWRRPTWANRPRPAWARNNGWRAGSVLLNPRPIGGPWGWNRGARWAPRPNYWGGGFWGPFAPFALTAGAALWQQTRFTSPSSGSPGWQLFQAYGLTPARCGAQNLVYIYGPNDGVMCAYPNMYVQAGFYYVDPETLQLFVM